MTEETSVPGRVVHGSEERERSTHIAEGTAEMVTVSTVGTRLV
jgi:hypothetical protein